MTVTTARAIIILNTQVKSAIKLESISNTTKITTNQPIVTPNTSETAPIMQLAENSSSINYTTK